jgi:uncharacterized protein (TIGR02147 family)
MPNIFNYSDYRKFLADFYKDKKAAAPSFSYQNFSRQAGFSSKSFVYNVIAGKKNLSPASIVSLSEAMRLTRTEAAYFEKLVSMCQAGTFKERDFFYEQLDSVRPQNSEASSAKKIRQDQFEFFSKWYHVVIRSLIDIFPVKDDFHALASMVRPPITALQAKNSVRLLSRLGLIEKGKDGIYKTAEKILSTGPEVAHLAAQHFHLQAMELGMRALKEMHKEERNIYGMTLGISKKGFAEVRKIMTECQNRILLAAEKDRDSDGVYQLNVQFFPVSKIAAKRGSK